VGGGSATMRECLRGRGCESDAYGRVWAACPQSLVDQSVSEVLLRGKAGLPRPASYSHLPPTPRARRHSASASASSASPSTPPAGTPPAGAPPAEAPFPSGRERRRSAAAGEEPTAAAAGAARGGRGGGGGGGEAEEAPSALARQVSGLAAAAGLSLLGDALRSPAAAVALLAVAAAVLGLRAATAAVAGLVVAAWLFRLATRSARTAEAEARARLLRKARRPLSPPLFSMRSSLMWSSLMWKARCHPPAHFLSPVCSHKGRRVGRRSWGRRRTRSGSRRPPRSTTCRSPLALRLQTQSVREARSLGLATRDGVQGRCGGENSGVEGRREEAHSLRTRRP
jgi:hypothetical protein